MQVITIGLDLAKSVFQVHGVNASGSVLIKKKLRRSEVLRFFNSQPTCLVGMEACATAHHWAREISALGHEVRLMPPAYVKAYVRRQKNDAADAEAICEAATRPNMRFVPIKSAERQGVLVLHRTRELLVRQRTMLINAIRGHCAEFGLIARPTSSGGGVGGIMVGLESEFPRLLRTDEAASLLGLSGRTLEKHRTYGTGPVYRKIGGRVVYAVSDLQTWSNQGRRRSTSERAQVLGKPPHVGRIGRHG